MKDPEEMTDEELLHSRSIVSKSARPDGGYDVMLSCGHGAIYVIEPAIFSAPCAQCVNVLAERNRKRAGK